MRTRLTELLDIQYPIMLAGMGGVSYHNLVAAVSEAGGLGTFGASTMQGGELEKEIDAMKQLTSKPFGVDLLTALPHTLERDVELIIKSGARVFVAGLGVPREIIDRLHKSGVLVGSMCGKVRHAVSGTVATMALVPQVVDAVGDKMVVVAAGGLFDGRGLAASLALGADGVWVGTRFIATHEARGVDGYKEKLIETLEDGTVITRSYTGKTCRVVRNNWTNKFEEHPETLQGFPQQAIASMQAGVNHLGYPVGTKVDVDQEFMPAGQGVGAITSIVHAADLVHSMMAEAEQSLDRIQAMRK
jgi:enoyl-[acyl-carrier protein] reductase II